MILLAYPTCYLKATPVYLDEWIIRYRKETLRLLYTIRKKDINNERNTMETLR